MQSTPAPAHNRVLLPTNVTPVKYNLTLTPHLPDAKAVVEEKPGEFTFDGHESIQVKVNHATTTITVHSKEIKISAVEFSHGNDKHKSTDIKFDEKLETVTFTFGQTLPVGDGVLDITFQGILNDQMAGFYRSKYTQGWLATTQFEPTDARRSFPCWDEPALKAKFSITLIVPKDLLALSNMPEESSKVVGDKRHVTFLETPIMSTYLIAYVVGLFDHVEGKTKEGVAVRVFTPVGKKEQGEFALNVAIKTLSYYTEFFGVGYPLPKSDMIAIPDFAAGAMENWGLITYRETALLVDPAQASVAGKQRVAYVVGHELAHMWFGNLVTMEWWRELWLNEGFATYVGNMAVDHLFPEWDIWTKFCSDHLARAFDLDSLKTSHPIEVEVESSAQVNEIFDAISYSKGASVVRMVFNYIGEANFKKGLNIYLNKFKYRNAKTVDLWAAFAEASHLPVPEFMNNWTTVTGYPVLSITEKGDKGEFEVEQEIFLASGEKVHPSPLWWINAGFKTSSGGHVNIDVKGAKQTITVPGADGHGWVKANAGLNGFFRVNYSPALFARLEKALDSGKELSTVDRLGLQNDAFAMAKAGRMSTAQVLSLIRAYSKHETDGTVWTDIAKNLGDVSTVWAGEKNIEQFRAYIREVFGPLGKRLGWDKKDGENDLDTLLRPTILSKLGGNGDEATIEEAKKRFAKFLTDNQSLPADLRGTVYGIVVSRGGLDEWEKVKKIYLESSMQEEKVRALRALGLSKDASILKKALDLATSTAVRSQDMFFLFAAAASSTFGRDITWQYLRDNLERIEGIFGKGSFLLLGRIISYTIGGFSSEERAKEIEDFFKAHPIEPAKRSIEQGLEAIRTQAGWLHRDSADVATFLKAYESGDSKHVEKDEKKDKKDKEGKKKDKKEKEGKEKKDKEGKDKDKKDKAGKDKKDKEGKEKKDKKDIEGKDEKKDKKDKEGKEKKDKEGKEKKDKEGKEKKDKEGKDKDKKDKEGKEKKNKEGKDKKEKGDKDKKEKDEKH